ncbi:hypothetical protein M5K25_009831 [Dendrobium thyrsiflorum]|uniref:Uncharacterized protein n=1 Tax=Dendrobium thyrsiflorum TaxID=117978 RepID=A0ABD0V634_DENTH
MAGWVEGPIMDKIISACFDYVKDQVGWQTGMKKELERLRKNHPKIQAVVLAANQAQINDKNMALNKWIWQLRDAIDEADDVLDELEYMKHKEQIHKNTEETKKRKLMSCLIESARKIFKIGERGLKMDPTLQRLEEAVQKLDKVSADVTNFLHLLDSAKQEQREQEVDFYGARETGSLPKNDLIGRRREKERVMEWLRNPSNDPGTWYKNISLLSIVGHGGMGKTALLQHVYKEARCCVRTPDRPDANGGAPHHLDAPDRPDANGGAPRHLDAPDRPNANGGAPCHLDAPGPGDVARSYWHPDGPDVRTQQFAEDEGFEPKMWVCVSKNFDVNRVIANMLESFYKKKPDSDSLDALQNLLENTVRSKKFLLVLDDIWKEEENSDISKWESVFAPLADGAFGSKILVTTRMASVAMMMENVIKKKTEIFTLKGLKDDECLELLKSHAFSGVENPNDHNISRVVKKLSGYPLAAKVIGCDIKSKIDEGRRMTIPERNFSITSLGKNYIYSIIRPSYIFLSNPLRNCFAFCCLFPQDYLFDKDDLVRMWIALGLIQPPHDQEDTMEDIGGRYFDDLVRNSFFDKVEDSPCYKMHVLLHETGSKFYPHEYSRVMDDEKLPPEISETIRHLYIQTINPDILREIGKVKYLHSLFLSYEASNQDFSNALTEILKASKSLRLLRIRTPRGLEMIPNDIGNLKHLRCLKIDGRNLTMLPKSLRNLHHLQYIIFEGPPFFSQPQIDEFLRSDINSLCNLRYLILPLNYISSIHGIGKLKSLQELDVFDFRNENGYKIGELKYMNDLRKLRINRLENVVIEEAHSANLSAKGRLTDLTLCWNCTNSRNIDLDENVLDNLQPPKCLWNLSIRNYMGARSARWMNDVNLISNLEKIELINCEKWETLPPFGQLPFLKSLELCNMPKVKLLESRISGNGEFRVFKSLKVLRIERLEALEDWFVAGVAVEDGFLFPSLIELVLKDCPQLKDLPYLPSELKSLEIENIGWMNLNFRSNSNSFPVEILEVSGCQNITSLPLADEIARLAALRHLAIINCPNLISLRKLPDRNIRDPSESLSSLRESPNLPPSLKDLSIWGCHPELFARYREDGGSDRSKIAHIPHIHISTEYY